MQRAKGDKGDVVEKAVLDSAASELLETFENIGDQGAREVARKALNGRGAFVKVDGQIGSGLILLAKHVVLVLVENAAIAPSELHGNDNGDQEARRLLRRSVVSERRDGFLQNRSMKDHVGIAAGIGRNAKTRARGELANDRIRHDGFSVVVIGARGEDGHGEGPRIGRQMRCGAQGVVAASGKWNQAEGQQENCRYTHVSILEQPVQY